MTIYIALGLEGFIDRAQDSLSGENVELVATADSISDEELETEVSHEVESNDDHGDDEADHEEEVHEEESHGGHDHGNTDPHVWPSPVLNQKLAESIKDSLLKADSEGAELNEANFEEIVQKEIGAEAVEMHNLGILTREDIDNGESYFMLMKKNIEVSETILK